MHHLTPDPVRKKRKYTYFYLALVSIISSFIVASIIYMINTYWYQLSKETRYQKSSNALYQKISSVPARNLNLYLQEIRLLLNSADEKTAVNVIQNRGVIVQLNNKTMNEYPNSNYLFDSKKFDVIIDNKPYEVIYSYKKRLGNTLFKDLLVAITFAYSSDSKAWWQKRLYKKSFIFYSYFILILLVSIVYSLFFYKRVLVLHIEENEITELLNRVTSSLIQENVNQAKVHDEVVVKIEQEYQEKLAQHKQYLLNNEKQNVYNNKVVSEIETAYESKIDRVREEVLDNIKQVDSINDSEHIQELISTLQNANQTVCILSGWMSSKVITYEMTKIFEQALERGVNIYIGFGWGSTVNDCDSLNTMYKTNQNALKIMFNMQRKYNHTGGAGRLYIGYFPTHQKILLQDDDFIICGSNNWLSNAEFKNHETSVKVYSKDLIVSERHRIKGLVERYEISYCSGTL